MPLNSGPCQTPRKYANAGEQQPRFGTRNGFLEILRESSAPIEPCKRSFNDPTSPLHRERSGRLGSRDDLNGPAAELRERRSQLFPTVAAVSENVTQVRKQHPDMLQQRYCSIAILDVGSMHLRGQQRSFCIGDDVPFAPFYLLTRIKPAWTACFCRLHGLAVDNSSRWRAPASGRTARMLYQETIDSLPNLGVPPVVKIMLNCREWRKVFRQSTPLAAGRKYVENRIHDDANIPLVRPSNTTSLRQQRLQHEPLFRRRVACITEPITPIVPSGGFGPSHVGPPRCFATTRESQQDRNHPLSFRSTSKSGYLLASLF